MTVNVIGDEGAKSISEVLKTNTTLTSLDLWSQEEGRVKKKTERNDE